MSKIKKINYYYNLSLQYFYHKLTHNITCLLTQSQWYSGQPPKHGKSPSPVEVRQDGAKDKHWWMCRYHIIHANTWLYITQWQSSHLSLSPTLCLIFLSISWVTLWYAVLWPYQSYYTLTTLTILTNTIKLRVISEFTEVCSPLRHHAESESQFNKGISCC